VRVTNIDGGRSRCARSSFSRRLHARRCPSSRPTRDQRLAQAGRDLEARTSGGGDFGTRFSRRRDAQSFRNSRAVGCGRRALASKLAYRQHVEYELHDILKVIRARTDAQMHRSTGRQRARHDRRRRGRRPGGSGSSSAVANRAAAAASPLVARACRKCPSENAITMRKGQRVANAARVVAAGAGGGAAQAAGEGSNVRRGAAYGARWRCGARRRLQGRTGAHAAVSRFHALVEAGQLLSAPHDCDDRTSFRRGRHAYRNATGAEPTLFELAAARRSQQNSQAGSRRPR
jgi:hypothetical protein